MILQSVASGRGLAALPQWAASQAIESGQVVASPLGKTGLWNSLFAAVRREDRGLAFMEAFVENARKSSFRTLEGVRAADG